MAQLPVPYKGLNFVKRVGSDILSEQAWLETSSEWARRVLPEFNFTKKNVILKLLQVYLFLPQSNWVAVLGELCRTKTISKRQLLTLYRTQTESIRRRKSVIFLADMYHLMSEDVRIFSDKEIVALASKVVTVSKHDVEFLMNTSELRKLLPLSLLKEWADDQAEELSMMNRARIAKRLFERNDDSLDFEMLCNGLHQSAELEPSSGAVQIFFTLLYSHKDIRTRQGRDRAREAFRNALFKMMLPLSRGALVEFFRARELLGWYLTNPFISQADKDWLEGEIRPHTEAVAKAYTNFIVDAKKNSPTAIEE